MWEVMIGMEVGVQQIAAVGAAAAGRDEQGDTLARGEAPPRIKRRHVLERDVVVGHPGGCSGGGRHRGTNRLRRLMAFRRRGQI